MTEKRFVYYEHKGADYILDTPDKSLDFIEMLGDCLEAEEIVDLLNEQHEQIERLKGNFRALDEVKCELAEENEELKQRNNRQYEQLGRLYYLIEQKKWRVLIDIVDDFKKSNEQLQKEWGTYGDVE